jgi:hypothetical protein
VYTLFLLEDGSVWTVEWRPPESEPALVYNIPLPEGDEAVDVACGSNHDLVLLRGGRVLAWGCNRDGQLGDGTRTDRGRVLSWAQEPVPIHERSDRPVYVRLPETDRVAAMAAGPNFSLFVLTTGEILATGENWPSWPPTDPPENFGFSLTPQIRIDGTDEEIMESVLEFGSLETTVSCSLPTSARREREAARMHKHCLDVSRMVHILVGTGSGIWADGQYRESHPLVRLLAGLWFGVGGALVFLAMGMIMACSGIVVWRLLPARFRRRHHWVVWLGATALLGLFSILVHKCMRLLHPCSIMVHKGWMLFLRLGRKCTSIRRCRPRDGHAA